jgi:hypothetical protein
MGIKMGMPVRIKTAKWIQKVFSIGILLTLIVGCSSGPSAQEKRNNYDACIIDWNNSIQSSDLELIQNHRNQAESQCVYLLR